MQEVRVTEHSHTIPAMGNGIAITDGSSNLLFWLIVALVGILWWIFKDKDERIEDPQETLRRLIKTPMKKTYTGEPYIGCAADLYLNNLEKQKGTVNHHSEIVKGKDYLGRVVEFKYEEGIKIFVYQLKDGSRIELTNNMKDDRLSTIKKVKQ